MLQHQAMPVAQQQNPLHSGGVIDVTRTYGGLDLRWLGSAQLQGQTLSWVAGLACDDVRENRRGFENYLGPVSTPDLAHAGRLRRDERSHARNWPPIRKRTGQSAISGGSKPGSAASARAWVCLIAM